MRHGGHLHRVGHGLRAVRAAMLGTLRGSTPLASTLRRHRTEMAALGVQTAALIIAVGYSANGHRAPWWGLYVLLGAVWVWVVMHNWQKHRADTYKMMWLAEKGRADALARARIERNGSITS